jgi:hypothetical protein
MVDQSAIPQPPVCIEFPGMSPLERQSIWEAAQRIAAGFKPPTPAQRAALRLVWCTPTEPSQRAS